MVKCIRCGVGGDDVKLFDAIYDGRMESICERCSIIENVVIIRSPDSVQLKEVDTGEGVYSRMKRMSGLRSVEEEESFFIGDKLKELDAKPELELPEKDKLNLIEHFYWHIMKNRRHKGLSQGQLAEALGESEAVIQMIENGKFPENAESLIRKLEQFFQIKLKKVTEMEKIMKEKEEKEAVLLDERGEELEVIPEEEFEVISEEVEVPEVDVERNVEIVEDEPEIDVAPSGVPPGTRTSEEVPSAEGNNSPVRDLDIKEVNPSAVTIADLKEMQRKKVDVSRQERVEEQKMIEERQRMIEARKEELRLIKEKESDDLNSSLGGAELLGGSERVEKRDSDEELI
jgi:ribosome-binding protein aMBF1 (putative translation factor)